MKKILITFFMFAGISLIPSPSQSQDQQGCFIFDPTTGKRTDLSRFCNNNSTPVKSGLGKFQVPIKRRNSGIPVIDVKFNGRQTFEMMLDTGASDTVLTTEMAKTLGVKQEGVILVNTPSDTQVQFPIGKVSSVEVGGVVAKNLSVAISPSLSVGLLGQSFFGKHDVVIKEKMIEFHSR
jgi:clan AA aspartic protease (TIGR02281 family)